MPRPSPPTSAPTALPIARIWPHLPAGWILAEGPGWVAVNKPVECGEHLPLGDGNALLRRLALSRGLPAPPPTWSLQLPPISAAARPHLRDDASTSGVSLISIQAAASAPSAATTTAETDGPPLTDGHLPADARNSKAPAPRQTWLAGVHNLPALSSPAGEGLRAGLATLGVALRERARHGSRVLLEVTTADTRDWPAELHRRGCPVVGLSRTRATGQQTDHAMLHRLRVEVGALRLEAPQPKRFQRWLRGEPTPLPERLRHALRRRYALGRATDTDAFRLFDDERGLTLDRYGPDLVLSSYDALPDPLTAPERLATALKQARQRAGHIGKLLGARSVWLKLRPQQANHIVDAQALGLVPVEPVYGSRMAPLGEAIVEEAGVRYWVRLGDGLSTGIFLDQRDNRTWLKRAATDQRVLNTFSYTCGFSIAAAVGGARRTVSIDASAGALERGRANLALNGHDDSERHDTLRGDVFQWLPRMARRGDRFDIIILDPPSYAKVKKRRFSAMRDYAELVASAAELLAPGGTILCCINHARVERRRFEQMVREGSRIARREVRSLHHCKPGVDHPGGRMKSLRLRLD